ncbi:tetratricopeptide repeat-containing sensor histidine kinase [Flavobacterium sp.]|uniref:tetratricopeptide repeat-containing sensor histidine kinase n=1 Tax=Flavobacterium sp. TaxID=239 RepID=UPI00260025A9|nr:tetratricopeptide repeat-containing sensor histidine kinase [Flavobacterium sp.]
MSKKTIYIFYFIFFYSCSKQKEQINSNKSSSDSLSYYMHLSNRNGISNKDKILALEKSFLFSSKLKNTKINRDTIFSISYKSYLLKNWPNFNIVNKFLLNKSLESKDTINLIKSYRYRGAYFKNIQELDSSFYYYVKAEKLCTKINDQLNLANVLLNKGIVQFSINDYLGSELSLSKAAYIFKNSNEKDKLYGTLNQLGLVYNELKDYDKAFEYHTKALETVREYNLQSNIHQEAICYNNIGYLYIKQNKYDLAISNFELGLKDKLILKDDPDLYALLIDNLAYCRFRLNNYEDLPKLFYDALKIRIKLENYTVIVGSYIHLSEYYQKKGDNFKAVTYSTNALNVARKSKIPTNIILALKQASLVDKIKSPTFSEQYIRISDSLQIAERNSKDRFARISLETDEIIKQNDVLENKNRTLLYIFLVTSIIVVLLIMVRAQRTRTRELVYKQAQQIANEEIFNLMMSQQTIIDDSRSKEKKRLAQDLHDGILGRMFGLRLSLDSINANNDADAVQKRNSLLNELKIIEQDIREISHDLNREKLVLINNFVSIVHNLLEEQKALHSSSVNYSIDENINWDKVGNTAKINMFRILQEGLQNINKYANANEIKVAVKGDNENVYLKIEDDGIGFDVNKKSKGIGMQNMISRTKESEGIIDINSIKNKGTKITITIPLKTKPIIEQQA